MRKTAQMNKRIAISICFSVLAWEASIWLCDFFHLRIYWNFSLLLIPAYIFFAWHEYFDDRVAKWKQVAFFFLNYFFALLFFCFLNFMFYEMISIPLESCFPFCLMLVVQNVIAFRMLNIEKSFNKVFLTKMLVALLFSALIPTAIVLLKGLVAQMRGTASFHASDILIFPIFCCMFAQETMRFGQLVYFAVLYEVLLFAHYGNLACTVGNVPSSTGDRNRLNNSEKAKAYNITNLKEIRVIKIQGDWPKPKDGAE